MSLFRSKKGHEVAKYSDRVYEWRRLVTVAVLAAHDGPPLEGPLLASLVFELERPKGHSGTGRNAGELRPSAPTYPSTAPDLDKLIRAVFDSITDAGTVWSDDSQVVRVVASKIYADGDSSPGVTVRVVRATT